MEYNTEYFDEEFFEGRTGKKGGDRLRGTTGGLSVSDGVAAVLSMIFNGKSFIDVGCGVGWFTKFLQARGVDVCGVELSQYAVDRAVAQKVMQGDMRDLSFINEQYDVVLCWNVIAYLEEKDIDRAIKSLENLSKGHIVLGIGTAEILKERPHGKPGRLTIKPWKWWMARFEKCGLVQDTELAAKINKLGGESWNVFCLKARD